MTRNEMIQLLGLLKVFQHTRVTPQAASEGSDRHNAAVVVSQYVMRDLEQTAPKRRD